MNRSLEAPAAARCPDHPDRLAARSCTRCGRFVCSTCLSWDRGEPSCPGCGALSRVRPGEPSTRSVVALAFGLLAIQGCLPLGPLALAAGLRELARIRRREVPESGGILARWAVGLGGVSSLLLLGLLVAGGIALV